MKPMRFWSRKPFTIGAQSNVAAQEEDMVEGQGSPERQLADEEAMAKMAEFVAENPNVFKELGRYFKR